MGHEEPQARSSASPELWRSSTVRVLEGERHNVIVGPPLVDADLDVGRREVGVGRAMKSGAFPYAVSCLPLLRAPCSQMLAAHNCLAQCPAGPI